MQSTKSNDAIAPNMIQIFSYVAWMRRVERFRLAQLEKIYIITIYISFLIRVISFEIISLSFPFTSTIFAKARYTMNTLKFMLSY